MIECIVSQTRRLQIAASENLAIVTKPQTASLEELKHDCRSKIWEYLPSSQLYELISSLKSNQFLREISLYELRARSPFSLCQEKSDGPSYRYGVLLLKDRFEETAATVNHGRRKGLKHSPIFELIQSANLLIGIDAYHVVGFWADLILLLPHLSKIMLNHHVRSSFSRHDALRVFAHDFEPVFANLSHFGLLNWDRDSEYLNRETTHVRMLLQGMHKLGSLEIPVAFLDQISTRRPGDWEPLRHLSLYSMTQRIEEPKAEFATVAELCPELESFEYISRTDRQGLTCSELPRLYELLALPKLRKLSLDTGRGEPLQLLNASAQLAATVAPLNEVHLTYRRNNEFGTSAPPGRASTVSESLFLFARVASLSTLRISLEQPHFTLGVLAQLRRIAAHNAPPIYLRRLKIDEIPWTILPDEKIVQSQDLRATASQVLSGKFLEKWLDVCPNLESIDASGICIDLSGYIGGPRPDPGSGDNGFWGIAAIVNAIRSSPSIKYVKTCAKVDSIAALKSELPGNCGVFDAVERPLDYAAMEGCVLNPDKYWKPVSLLIVGPKENFNTFHLRILVNNK